jgi:hypothetical protein
MAIKKLTAPPDARGCSNGGFMTKAKKGYVKTVRYK